MNPKQNRYDYCVIFLITLLAFGGIGGAFQPVRIVGLLFSPIVIFKYIPSKKTQREGWVLGFVIFWLFYILVSLLWTPSITEGLKELGYYFVHFVLFFLLVYWGKKAVNPIQALITGWIFALFLTLPIALYEVITFNHLPISRFDSDKLVNLGGQILNYRFASVTYANSNTYVVHILMCLPFLLARLLQNNKFLQKNILWSSFFITIIILFINASRGGVLSLLVYTFFFIAYYFRENRSKIKAFFYLVFATLVTIGIFVLYAGELFIHFFYRTGDGGRSLTFDASRMLIYGRVVNLFIDSIGIGTGAGSMEIAMYSPAEKIASAHNLLLELLLQYGLFVFVLFLIFLYKIFRVKIDKSESINRFILSSTLIAFISFSIINSSYLLMPQIWIFFGSLFICGMYPLYKIK